MSIDLKRIVAGPEAVDRACYTSQEVFEAEIQAAGFRKIGEPLQLKDNYVTRFRKVRR